MASINLQTETVRKLDISCSPPNPIVSANWICVIFSLLMIYKTGQILLHPLEPPDPPDPPDLAVASIAQPSSFNLFSFWIRFLLHRREVRLVLSPPLLRLRSKLLNRKLYPVMVGDSGSPPICLPKNHSQCFVYRLQLPRPPSVYVAPPINSSLPSTLAISTMLPSSLILFSFNSSLERPRSQSYCVVTIVKLSDEKA